MFTESRKRRGVPHETQAQQTHYVEELMSTVLNVISVCPFAFARAIAVVVVTAVVEPEAFAAAVAHAGRQVARHQESKRLRQRAVV